MSANAFLNDVDIDFLHDISSRFATEDPLHQDLERIIEFASALVRCDSCFIYIREGDDLVLRASKNPHGEEVGRLKLALGQGIAGWVAEHREPVAVSQHAWQERNQFARVIGTCLSRRIFQPHWRQVVATSALQQ